MKIGILAAGDTPSSLKGEFSSFAKMTSEMFLKHLPQATFEYFEVRDGHFPDEIRTMDAWAITGSVNSANEELPWMLKLEALIIDIVESNRALVGICFGHQIIAKALGGKVEKYVGGWGVGLHEYQWFNKSNRLNDEKLTSWLPAFHQDQVVDKPKKAEVILNSPFCPNAALLYGKSALTCQFHPEFSVEFEQALLAMYQDNTIPQEVMVKAQQSLIEQQPDNEKIGRLLGEFIENR